MPVLRPSSHDDRISITVNLAALSSGQQGFSTILILDKNETVNGTVTTYTSATDASADETAGEISALASAAVAAIFAQSPRPTSVKVAPWDATGGDSVSDALDDALAIDTDFYGVCVTSRLDADILALAAKATSLATAGTKVLAFVQSADSDWLTASHPAALTALETNERAFVLYHDSGTSPEVERWAGKWLAFDPDERSAPCNTRVASGAALTTALTATQKSAARANAANVALLFGTSTKLYVDPGHSQNSRPGHQILTADWLEVRVREAIADLIATQSELGVKIPVNADGQNRIAAAIESIFELGVSAGHFQAGQTSLTAESITAADRTAQRLRFTGAVQTLENVIQVSFTFNLSTDPVVADAA